MTRTNRAACLLCLTGTLSSCCKRLVSSSLMGALLFSCRRCFVALSMVLTPSASAGTPLTEPASLELPLFDVVHLKLRACGFRAPPPPCAPAPPPAPRIAFKAKKDYERHRKLRNHMPQLPLSCEARGKFPVQLQGLLRELSPGPLAPEARIMPLDQAAAQRSFHL